jgi:hypothetical protein
MVLGAALIEKTENKCSTYFQGITVIISFINAPKDFFTLFVGID